MKHALFENHNKYTPHQGKRECTRRIRQMCKYGGPAWFKEQGDKHRTDITSSPLWPMRNKMPAKAWYAFTGETRYG